MPNGTAGRPGNLLEYKNVPCPACGELVVEVHVLAVILQNRFNPSLCGRDAKEAYSCLGCGAKRGASGRLLGADGNEIDNPKKIEEA